MSMRCSRRAALAMVAFGMTNGIASGVRRFGIGIMIASDASYSGRCDDATCGDVGR